MAKATPAPTAEVAADEPKKRERLSFSKEKKLAYLIINLTGILLSKAVAAVLTEEQKTKVTAAKKTAKEIGGDDDPLKGCSDRITAIGGELKALDYTSPAAPAQAKELGLELDRQFKRKKQIEEMLGV